MYRYLYIAFLACGPAPQQAVRYPITAVVEPVVAVGDWTITLDRAELGFGPLYFCASQSARASLCTSAVAELTDVVSVNLLDTAPQPLGEIDGVTGSIRSATWDYGVTWLMTEQAPNERLQSLVLSGVATRGAEIVPFAFTLNIAPKEAGTHAVLGARTSATIDSDVRGLEVHFRPADWLNGVDFSALGEADSAIILNMTANAPPAFRWLK